MLSTLLLLPALALAKPLIVGLGSSYSYGPGLANPIGKILQQKLIDHDEKAWTFTNNAVSGSVLTDVTYKQAPKLNGTDPSIVYIVSGGNDLTYVTCLADPTNSVCTHLLSEDVYKTRYEDALDAVVANTAGDSGLVIFVVDYIQALGADTNCGTSNSNCPLTPAQVEQDSEIYNKVVNYTVDTVTEWKKKHNGVDLRLIPMREYSSSHAVGSSEPWINGKNVQTEAGGIAWHPNNAGAQAVAQYIYESYTKVDC